MNNSKKLNIIVGIVITIILGIVIYLIFAKDETPNISLNKHYIKIYEQNQEKLEINTNAENNINQDIIWISDNPEIASVDANGTITGNKVGSTKIYVKTKDGESIDLCYIDVAKKILESFKIDDETITNIQIGETEEIKTIILPKDLSTEKINWTSDDSNIVTIDENGKITGISEGITLIKGELLGQAIISPIFVGTKITSITLDKKNLEIEIEKNDKLNVTINPEEALNETILWESSNPNILEVDMEGNIKAKEIGNVTITATTQYSQIKDTCQITVTKKKYEVKFMELNKTINVFEGEKITNLPSMTKQDYNFLGWYTSSIGGTKVDENTIVINNIVLYPHFEPKETYTEGPGGTLYSRTVTYMGRTFKDYKQNRMGATIEARGCGPVALYSILSGYDDSITLEQIISVTGLSTSFTYINHAARKFGLNASKVYVYSSSNPNSTALRIYTETAIAELKKGHQLIVLVTRSSMCPGGNCNGLPYDAYSWGNHFIAIIGVKKDGEHVIIFNPMESRMEEGRMEDIIKYYLPGGPQSGFVVYSKS